MKKFIYLLMVIGLVFTACDPMEDIYEELNLSEIIITGDDEYIVTDENYEDLGLTYGSFNNIDEVKTLIPPILTDLQPQWGKGSSFLVSFNLYVGNAEGVSDYTYADIYSLENTDYPGSADNAVGFYPNQDPEDYMNDILNNAITNPVEGQIVLAKYKVYTEDPVVGIANLFETNFNGSLENYEALNVLGDEGWYDSSFGGVEYAKMNGYSGGPKANEDWLISPEIDLTSQTNVTFQMNQAINYLGGQFDQISVLVSTDFTSGGDHTTAIWTALDLQTIPAGSDWTFVTSEDFPLTTFEGETIHIAFKYLSSITNASTWEIDQVLVKTPGVEGDTSRVEVYYTYIEGTWELAEGVYFISDDDFDSMGEAYGQPGYYNNFGSTIPPDNYLPTFLGIKYPYAMEGDELNVVYDYYSSSSGAQLRGNLYTVIDGVWVGHQSTISTTLQFGHDGTTWVPDNTIKYTLVGDDYVWIAGALEGVAGYEDLLSSLANYKDFDYNWTEDQLVYSLGLLADHLNPANEEGQKYLFTYLLYDSGIQTRVTYIILENGVWKLNE